MTENSKKPIIRVGRPGEEAGIHESHMRSIREICVKDHGEEEIKGWGYRPLGTRWVEPLKTGHVWVIELENTIQGYGYIRVFEEEASQRPISMGFILPLRSSAKGLASN